MTLRYYQQDAHDAAINFIKRSTETCLIEAEGGSGKSHMIAAIADTFHKISGKHVLCTAPSVDLVEQNTSKFLATGNKASIFSASISKSLRHPVVFGTPLTIANDINRFSDKFGLICIDESHSITPTIQKIVSEIRIKNDKLRVIGLSATPYRMGTGYIYELNEDGTPVPESQCKDPYFKQKIYTIQGRELIEQGFLTPPLIGEIHAENYDTLHMRVNSMGKFYQEDIDKAYTGQERKTSQIIHDIIKQSAFSRGVMIFAATVEHAKECMKSLPPELSRMIGGNVNMGKNERRKLVSDFKQMKFKYLVSIGAMTTGVDFPHVDVIALLRPSESVGLLRQILLRGARLFKDKQFFLILDYCEAITRHFPDADIFNPEIKSWGTGSGSGEVVAECPDCGTSNAFSARKNDEGFNIDKQGFFIDLMGNRIKTEYGDYPAHFGRRCYGQELVRGKFERCNYFYTHKVCPECQEKCDITARYCPNKHELIDPNANLIDSYKPQVIDPYQLQTDKVIAWHKKKTKSKNNDDMLVVNYITEARKLVIFYLVRRPEYGELVKATDGGETMPNTLTYVKDKKSGYYRAVGYNQ